MLLTIDVGNTNIVFGLHNGQEFTRFWRMSTRQNHTSDEMGAFISSWLNLEGIAKDDLKDIIISSVVPDIMYSLDNATRKYLGINPLVVGKDVKMNITLPPASQRDLGTDRIVNCVAAYTLFGGPAIIIDFGTATTYDAISKNGEFITGLTCPGIKISADALFSRAALLGKVELSLPSSMLVQTAAERVQAGILYGAIGQTEYIVNALKKEIGEPDAVVVATGGLSHTIAEGTQVFDHIIPSLTLEGLKILHDLNKE